MERDHKKQSLLGGFGGLASNAAHFVGSPIAFTAAVAVVVIWALLGPTFRYSDSWQLVINTGTTIITFLIVFLIQNTQNRDARAIHLKLDEIIRSIRGAHNEMIDIEKLSDDQLQEIADYFQKLRSSGEGRDSRLSGPEPSAKNRHE